ncbi:hypothetical protein AURDEDRAFT_121204 [Auricularia subglabra TFB-10046 SS5]|nr:hypothetical protein AURDEDRAFT_121204 [Auricularia subglabra TFB-10046 SS5]
MFQLAHAAWPASSHPSSDSSSLAHALGFNYPVPDPPQPMLLPALPPPPPPPALQMQTMVGVIIPAGFAPAPARPQSVKPEPAEPSLQHGQHGALVYVFENARRTEDGSISFDLCDEESMLARPPPAPSPVPAPRAAAAAAGGMKAMMGVFRVNPFTGPGPRGEQLACSMARDDDDDGAEEDEDGEEMCDGAGESFEFRLDSMTQHAHAHAVTQRRDNNSEIQTQTHTLDLRHALPPFISAACSSSASPSSSSTLGSMDSHSSHAHSHSQPHHHSRPSTAASSHSGSGSSFAPSALTLTPTPSHSAASQTDTGGSNKKKPKKVKMHACDVCHKEFPRPSGLQTHMNVHSGAKPYKCPVPGCSKRFGVRSNATRHLRVHQRQQAHAAAQQQQAAAAQRAPPVTVSDQWLDMPDVLRPTPADVLAAQQQHHQHQQSQRWVPDSLSHLTNALELPTAQRGPRVESAAQSLPDAGDWPYHPSQVSSSQPSAWGGRAETTKQWASKLPGPGPIRQQWAQPSHTWVGA